ncbi:uncharacterized protein LOC142224414 [Haematobia irritans]|uniref:uncharacterized protein LOC142224414 n=1 Tax=Haematobia irritans TaxID=7368 RepID=UPI003F4F5A78
MRNLQCVSDDPEFSRFDLCEFNPIGRKVNILIKLLKIPLTNGLITSKIIYTKSRNTPLVNGTWDVCDFLKNTKRGYVMARMYGYISSNTNINHTCPFNHDLYIRNLTLYGKKPFIPVPKGDYIVNITLSNGGRKRFTISFVALNY